MSEPYEPRTPDADQIAPRTATALRDGPQEEGDDTQSQSLWRYPPAAGDTGGGGWGAWGGPTTWAPPPPRPPRPHPLRALAVGISALSLVAASVVVGFALGHQNASGGSGGSASAPSSPGAGRPSNGTTSHGGASVAAIDPSKIASQVDPGLVDVNTQLGYQGDQAAGTGMVLTPSGVVLTNNHVVEGATSISVTDIGNGRTYGATVLGTDATDDVALLQLTGASGLETVSIGNSSNLSVGDAVVAIGNAGGVGGTPSVSAGQVTALNQDITASDDISSSSEQLQGLIETDADLQPGDSGGPLVDSAGKVVGMDTAASSSFQFQSASTQSYAITVDKAVSIALQIESGRSSSTVHIGAAGFLGVEVTSDGLTSGAQVMAVEPGTPAANAGLQEGDLIDSLDGQSVSSPGTLSSIMEGLHPGDTVELGWVDLSGQQQSAQVTLATGPAA
jgi:S1-C subfamily serine protease